MKFKYSISIIIVLFLTSISSHIFAKVEDTSKNPLYLKYKINLKVEPSNSFLEAQSVIEIDDYKGNELKFKLLKSLQILDVKTEDLNYTIDQTDENYNILNFYQKPQSKNTKPTIFINYSGKVYNLPNETNLNQRHSNSIGIISPKNNEGIYLPGGSFYPSLDNSLNTFECSILAPKNYTMITSGNIINDNTKLQNNESKSVTYVTPFPTDEITIVGGNYVAYSKQYDGVTFNLFTYDSTVQAETYLNSSIEYYKIYTKLFGDYPFKIFSIVENFFATGFGMPGYTLLSGKLLAMPWVTLSPGSLAHEFVHNWWGNSVYVDYNGGNWCEALTTFSANYYYNIATDNKMGAIDWRKKALMSIDALPPSKNYPVKDFQYQKDMDDAVIGYQKGAFIFYEVMKIIGEDNFFYALKNFSHDFRGKRAYWNDLINEFSKFAPKEYTENNKLGTIIERWISSTEEPKVILKNAFANKDKIEFTLEKSDDLTITIPVLFYHSNGFEKNYYTISDKINKLNYSTQLDINKVIVDPNYEALRKLYSWEKPFSFNQTLASNPIIVLPNENSPNYNYAQEFYKEMLQSEYKCTTKKVAELTEQDISNNSLILLGTIKDNLLIQQLAKSFPEQFKINGEQIEYSGKSTPVKESIMMINLDHPKSPNHFATIIYYDNLPNFDPIKRLFHYQSYSMVLLSLSNPGRPLFNMEIFPSTKSKSELIKDLK
jgi:hypothetical protein